jgi:hypothetical protein
MPYNEKVEPAAKLIPPVPELNIVMLVMAEVERHKPTIASTPDAALAALLARIRAVLFVVVFA